MQNTAQVAHQHKTESINFIESQPNDLNTNSPSPENRQSCTNKDQEYILERNDYSIRLVNSLKQHIKTSTFLQSIYASSGYLTEKATTFTRNPHQITLEATSKQQLLGTLTLTIDSGQGLLADTLYKPEVDTLRTKNKKICEISKLAFKKNASSKKILAELFHLTFIYARLAHKATDATIEVNPRHASFYERMLGFHQIGKQNICPRVSAPAVLLHLELEHIDKQLTSATKTDKNYKKSIYPYFLSQLEAKELADKISA